MKNTLIELTGAQNRAKEIFREIVPLVQQGMSEKEAQANIISFLEKHPEVDRLWHQVVVKFDKSTIFPEVSYIATDKKLDNLVTVDLGFVISGLEVNYAETWVLSNDSALEHMITSTKRIWNFAAERIHTLSPAKLFASIQSEAKNAGYSHIAPTAGHKLGKFPTKKSIVKIRANETIANFEPGGWMIEIHLSNGAYGAFYEDLVIL